VRAFGAIGTIAALLAVAAGAFGAHALRASLDERALAAFETAARYQMFHALGLVAVALVGESRAARVAGWSFLTGIVLFAGSLYAWSLSGIRVFAMITPLGGLAFMVGWIALAVAFWPRARA
jgi:uncharacterized membrane protein YgdD (TMEM256/DUF423 family)